jgi:hypothetical protein
MAVMSQRQYSVHKGLSRAAVQKAISTGRISTLTNGMIDSEMADREWEANTSAPVGETAKLTRARLAYTVLKAKLADLQYKQLSGDLLPRNEVEAATFNASRRIRDACQNIPSRCCGAIAGEVRRALEAAGLAPEAVVAVASKLTLVEIDNLLAAEIRAVLNDLADGLAVDVGQ